MTEGQIQRKRVFVRKCGEFEITQFGLVGFNCRCERAIQSCNPECCVDCCLDYIPKLTIFFVLIYFFVSPVCLWSLQQLALHSQATVHVYLLPIRLHDSVQLDHAQRRKVMQGNIVFHIGHTMSPESNAAVAFCTLCMPTRLQCYCP